MTKIVIASDAFKGSASSAQVAHQLGLGIRRIAPATQVVEIPMGDGGEGTVASLVAADHGTRQMTTVRGPLGELVTAEWGLLADGTAVIEVAAAAGLPQVSGHLAPLTASTYGVGELIKAALDAGATTIYLGLGGSASTDGGVGMVQALGGRFTDANGQELLSGGGFLPELTHINLGGLDPRLSLTHLIGLADVTAPLTGADGAAAVFAPQKGATAEQVPHLEVGLQHLAAVTRDKLHRDVSQTPGAGAAGGTGFGLLAFLGGELAPGTATMTRLVHLEEQLIDADLVITGEGRLDGQSLMGKLPVGVARLAHQHHVPVVAVTGQRSLDSAAMTAANLDLVLPIVNRPMSLKTAIAEIDDLLRQAGDTIYRAWRLGR